MAAVEGNLRGLRGLLARVRGSSVGQNTVGTVATGVAGQLIIVVSGILVARLGPENRGHLALMTLFPLILSLLCGFGAHLAATYHIARGSSAAAIVRRQLPWLTAHVAAFTAAHVAVLWLVFADERGGVQAAAIYTLILVPTAVLQMWALAVLQGQQRFAAFNILRLLPFALYSAGVGALFALDAGTLRGVAFAYSASWIVGSAATAVVAYTGTPRTPGATSPPVGEMRRFGRRGILGWVFPVESFSLDQVFVGLLLSPAALGYYVIAAAFTNLPRFIAQSLGMVAYPHVAAASERARARRGVWVFFAATTAVCLVVVGGLEAVIRPLIPFFFGDEFTESVPIARVLLVAALFLALRRVLADAVRGAGHPSLGTVAEVTTWFAAVPALIVGLQHGALGVAWGMAATYAVSLAVLLVLSVRSLRGPGEVTGRPAAEDGLPAPPSDPSGAVPPPHPSTGGSRA